MNPIPLCPETLNPKKYSPVTTSVFPFGAAYVCMSYACGAAIFSDGPKFLNVCPDCGAGWVYFQVELNQIIPKARVAETFSWTPPPEYKATL